MKQVARRLGFLAVLTALGFLLARMLSKTVEDDEAADGSGPARTVFVANERRYPPFSDKLLEGESPCVEGEYDEGGERQIAIIGVTANELRRMTGTFSLARCDASSLWHPAVSQNGDEPAYTVIDGPDDEYAMLAMYVGAGQQHMALGVMHQGNFMPYKQTRLVALTNKDGLAYDYPTVPLVNMKG